MRACVDLGNDWPMVLSVGKKLVPVYETVYPKVSSAMCAIEPWCVDTKCELQDHSPTEQIQSWFSCSAWMSCASVWKVLNGHCSMVTD